MVNTGTVIFLTLNTYHFQSIILETQNQKKKILLKNTVMNGTKNTLLILNILAEHIIIMQIYLNKLWNEKIKIYV